MKTYTNTIFMITICTLTFSSCSKKKDVTPPGKGSVVFWTKNAAYLTACSNYISIRLYMASPFGPVPGGIIDSAHLISVNVSAPSSCSNMSSAIENIPAQLYAYQIKDCATGLWRYGETLNIVTSVCRKIEIP